MPTRLEVICGPMFAGKTEEVLRRIRLERIAKRTVRAIKPYVDTRTDEACIASRAIENGKSRIINTYPATIVRDEPGLRDAFAPGVDTYVIDEAQFFDEPWFLANLANLLRRKHPPDLLVIVSGLDADYQVEPFGPMHKLITVADDVTRLTGICMRCHARGARLTQRIGIEHGKVVIDDGTNYEIRCRSCHEAFAPDDILAGRLRRKSD